MMESVEDTPASLTDLFDCPICFEDMSKNTSKLLQCGHSFCIQCLEKLNTENETIKCPSCRNSTPLSENKISNLPGNYFLEKLNQKMTGLLLKSRKMCGLCLGQDMHSKATCVCVQCQMNMCKNCKDYHISIPIFENHTFEDEQHNHHLCVGHQSAITCICLECKTGLCLRCTILSEHRNHTEQIRDLDSGVSEARNSLQSMKDSLATAIDDITRNSTIIARNFTRETLPNQCQKALTDILIMNDKNFITKWKTVSQKTIEALDLCRRIRTILGEYLSQTNTGLTYTKHPWKKVSEAVASKIALLGTLDDKDGIGSPVEVTFLFDNTVLCLDDQFNYASRISMDTGLVANYCLQEKEKIGSIANDSKNIYICGGKNLMQIPCLYTTEYPSEITTLPVDDQIDHIMCQDDNTILYKVKNKLYSYQRDSKIISDIWEGNFVTRYSYISVYKSGPTLAYFITKPKKNEILEQDINGSRYYGQTELKEPKATVVVNGVLLVCDYQNHRLCAFDIINQKYLGDLLKESDGTRWPTGIAYQFPYLCVTECNTDEGHGKVKFYKWTKTNVNDPERSLLYRFQ